jgi:hypothetical protein
MFNIDNGVTKDFSVGERTRVVFSWQAFNATNSVRYDVRGAQPFALLRPVTIRQICWNYHHASIHAVRIAIRVLIKQIRGFAREEVSPWTDTADTTFSGTTANRRNDRNCRPRLKSLVTS